MAMEVFKEKVRSRSFKEYVERLGTAEGWRSAYPILNRAGIDALEDVLEGLSHPNWRVRKWCAAFMDHYADDRCVDALVVALDDSIADVRRHAVHGIGCQPCKMSPLKIDVVALLIERALNDSSIRVRRSAVHLLGCQPPDNRVVKAIDTILQKDQDAKLRSNAKWALEQQEKQSNAVD